MSFPRRIAACMFAILLAVPGLLAQTVTGSITGSVTDSGGAALPGAHVTAHNEDTGVDTSATTNGAGFYRIEFLPIGHYHVTVQDEGFNQETLRSFTLEVLQVATFNVTMQVGSTATTVNVSGAAPILNTSDPTLGTTFTANAIQNQPLNGLAPRARPASSGARPTPTPRTSTETAPNRTTTPSTVST
jgi:hypothetical protein